MANVLGELFQDIADAIRSKTGSTDTLKPNEFPAAIEGITAGGGGSSADERVKYVTFVYEENGETKEHSYPVIKGDTCHDPAALGLINPTKASTVQYNYTFYGWGASDGGAADANILKNITEDKTVYAIFTATVRMYTITYLDDDGVKVLKTVTLPYGATPEEYTPGKDGFAFVGWDKEISTVTGDATYTAQWVAAVGGSCGDSASWLFDAASGVLTIKGTGKTANYDTPTSANPVPWVEYISGVTSIVIEEGITGIGDYSFYDHSAPTSITIPTTMRSYGTASFTSTTALKSVYYNGTLEQWLQQESITLSPFVAAKGNLYLNGTLLTDVVIPETITSIPDRAFDRCGSITSVTFHPSVTYIGISSFACPNLASATFPEGITTLGNRAFSGTTSLTSIAVPSTVTDLANAFHNCKWLTSFTVPETVTRLGEYAFYGCSGLTGKFTIPDTVTELGDYVFYGCEYLTSINLPTHITIVPDSAFYQCKRITAFPYHSGVTKIGRDAYALCTAAGSSVTIYSATTVIGPNCFSNNVKNATFQVTAGWFYAAKSDLSDAQSLPSSALSDTAVSAKTLVSNLYAGKWKFRK